MSLMQTYTYNNPANFTFDNTKIAVTSSAQLLLGNNPGQTFVPNISSSTFNPSLLTYSGGSLKQADQRPANATFYAAWTSMLNGNWSGAGNGSLTVTPVNGAAINGGRLDLTGSLNKYVTIVATNNADSTQTGSVEFLFTPNYSGSPANQQGFLVINKAVSDLTNAIVLRNAVDGNIFFDLYDQNAALIFSAAYMFTPVAGTTYTMLLQWDGTNGNNSLYINGTQVIHTTNTFTRNSSIGIVIIGSYFNESSGFNSNFSISNFSVYNAIVTPSTPSLSPTIYATGTANLPLFTYGGLGNVIKYTNSAITDSNAPAYTLNGLYWNGTSWIISNGTYNQANIASVIAAQIATLPVSNTLQINAIYQSENIQASLSSVTITYTGQLYPTTDPSIAPTISINASSLQNFADTQTAMGMDGIGWVLQIVGGSNYWFNGTAWAVSNMTFAQSNSTAQILTNYSTFPGVPPGDTIIPIALLHSNNGTTTPSLSALMINYTLFVPTPTPPNFCVVYAFLTNMIGIIPAAGAASLVITNPSNVPYGLNLIRSGVSTIPCDFRGEAQINVIESTTYNFRYFFQIKYIDDNGTNQISTLGWAQIPNQQSVDISTLTFYKTQDSLS